MKRLCFGVALPSVAWLVAACGSAAPVDFFEGGAGRASASAGSSAGGSIGVSGSVGTAGSVGVAGANAGSAGRSTIGPTTPCSPVVEGMNMTSGDFQTTGPLCFRITDEVVGWGCSNFEGRSIRVNGSTVTCGQVPLPSRIDGSYYFDISAGEFSYASFYWWSQ